MTYWSRTLSIYFNHFKLTCSSSCDKVQTNLPVIFYISVPWHNESKNISQIHESLLTLFILFLLLFFFFVVGKIRYTGVPHAITNIKCLYFLIGQMKMVRSHIRKQKYILKESFIYLWKILTILSFYKKKEFLKKTTLHNSNINIPYIQVFLRHKICNNFNLRQTFSVI